jgi:hypothetical protein
MTPGEWTWLLAGFSLLSYELWAVFTRNGDVLTRAMRNGLPRWTAVALGLGLLMGHLTGPKWPAWPYAWVIPFALLALALARDTFLGGRVDAGLIPILFLAGYAVGTFWVGAP